MRILIFSLLASIVLLLNSCQENKTESEKDNSSRQYEEDSRLLKVEFETLAISSEQNEVLPDKSGISLKEGTFQVFEVPVKIPGRYRLSVTGATSEGDGSVWVETYINNPDNRTYNISGDLKLTNEQTIVSVDGSPLDSVLHTMRIHAKNADITLDNIQLELIRRHENTPDLMTQSTDGDEWKVVWSDEFEGEMIDTAKWTYDVGNWGWGNNELQYYTVKKTENARIEDGKLVIEARKDDGGYDWTSARLTTRGKVSFLYGKIEFKAIVPRERGNWAAAWTLGDTYVDEIDWPYAGEIDIIESVGYEVDDETGDGIAHATVHTPAYYFKINNQISSTTEVEDIADEWHTYSVEWTPTEIKGFVDGEQYYLYDKTADELEWPFHQPQNLIINLAMGGGWGGAMGMDSTITSQKYLLDYVRVYSK